MIVTGFKAKDMVNLTRQGIKEPFSEDVDIISLALSRERIGLSATLWDGRHLAGCSGIDPLHNGVGQLWGMFNDLINDKAIEFMKISGDFIINMMADHDLHRVHSYVRQDFPIGKRYVQALGMQPEGIMRKFSEDGCDCTVYSIVR